MNCHRVFHLLNQSKSAHSKSSLLLPFALWVWLLSGVEVTPVQAQSITPATDRTGTMVDRTGDAYTIQGGQLSGDRANLFQSFGRFGLNANESATFIAAPELRNILGRVVGGEPSYINGLLQVTGGNANLFLMNPAGIVFGSGASLNVPGSFTATTANGIGFNNGQWFNAVGDNNYAALLGAPNTFAFTPTQPGAIANLGNLTVGQGQNITLLGGTILNTGQLTAPGGQITVAAVPGQNLVRLSQAGSLLSLEFTPLPPSSSPSSLGLSVSRSPTLPQLLTGGNISGATAVTVNSDGSIQLNGSSTPIATAPGTAIVSGQVSTASPMSSSAQITVLGDRVSLSGATLDASGVNGGTVRIGGDYKGQGTVPNARFADVDASTAIRADAIAPGSSGAIGNGGRVIVWSDHTTNFAGTITARGGSGGGNGGLVETSGRQTLVVAPTASVSTLAPLGRTGTWLLDPPDLTVVPTGGTAGITGGTNTPDTASAIDAGTIVTALNGNNVNLQADNSITVDAPVNASTNLGPGNLTLTAPTANLNQPITLQTGSTLSGTATTANVGPAGGVQNGVDVVVAGGTVNLAVTTYALTNTVNIAKSVTVNGVDQASTLVSGNNAVQVFNISGTGTVANLNNLTVTQGNAFEGAGIFINAGNTLTVTNSTLSDNLASNGGGINNRGTLTVTNSTLSNNTAFAGGGILNEGTLTVNNTILSGNSANNLGGGIYNGDTTFTSGATLTLTNSTLSGNVARGFGGGGIFNLSGNNTVTVTNSTLSSNTAPSGSGGGTYNDTGSNLTLNNSTISNNVASSSGGAIANGGGTVTVDGSTLSGNTASTGGGINNDLNGMLTITNSTITGNTASTATGGGVYNVASGTVAVGNSTFSSNTASIAGGGIFNAGTLTVDNSTLSDNSVNLNGGGIYNQGTAIINGSTLNGNRATNPTASTGGGIVNVVALTLTNSTLSGNSASTNGSGIFNNSPGNVITINNSTVSVNSADANGSLIYNFDGIMTISNSIVAGNAVGQFNSQGFNIVRNAAGASGFISTDLLNVNPLLSPLGNYGGSTQTIALLPGSPAINAAGAGATAIDQRGVAAVGTRDIGAFESRGFTITPSSDPLQATNVTRPFSPLVVTVSSAFGEPVAGGIVTFTSTPGSGGANASLSSVQSIINSLGQASVNATANAIAGSFTVSANTIGVTLPASFSLSNSLFQSLIVDTLADVFNNNLTLGDVSLREAIAYTDVNGTISFAIGLAGTIVLNQEELPITRSVTINGPGATILAVSGNNTNRVFTVSGAGTGATINNLTVTQGNSGDGGGILVNSGSALTLNNSTVNLNTAVFSGGGIFNSGSLAVNNSAILNNNAASGAGAGIYNNNSSANLTVSNSTISSNIARAGGGGIFNGEGTLTLINSSVSNNAGDSGGGLFNASGTLTATGSLITNNRSIRISGGGIFNNSGTLALTNSTISGNVASGAGGGLVVEGAPTSLTITDSTINENTADVGGGIFNSTGNLTVTNSTIRSNTASIAGGSIFNAGSVTINNSTISSNTAISIGGGIYNEGTAVIDGSTLSGNSANGSPTGTYGGGIFNVGILSLTNSTLSGNSAGTGGGGINNNSPGNTLTINSSTLSGNSANVIGSNIYNFDGTTIISNSIIAGNSGVTAPSMAGQFNSQGYNLIGNATGASGFVSTDLLNVNPGLAPLGNYGGPTQTMALLPGSPAINAGNFTITTTDQRGVAPVGIRDIGAFESRGFTLTQQANSTPQSTLVSTPFRAPLGLTVSSPFGEPVAGGVVNFFVPTSGASAALSSVTAVINSQGQVGVSAIANESGGSYTAIARAEGSPDASFELRNFSVETVAEPVRAVKQAGEVVQQDFTPSPPPPLTLSELPRVSINTANTIDTTETAIATTEDNVSNQFVSQLNLPEKPKPKTVPETRSTLRQIGRASGVQPAVLYIMLVPQADAQNLSRQDSTRPEVSRDPVTGNPTIRQVPDNEPGLQLLLVTPNGNPVFKSVPGATRSAILQTAREFRQEVADPSKIRTRSYLKSAQQLYQWFIAPIASELKAQNIKTIAFIMDTPIRFVPLAALHDGKQFLVEQFSVSLMPSFSLTNDQYTDLRSAQVLGAGASTFTDPNQNPLPAVDEEIATILSAKNRWQGKTLLDNQFTLPNLEQARRDQPFGIIHLATHGEFLPGNLSQSYIQLSNQKLSLDQIRTLGWNNPPAELVVLSACRMAIGNEDAELGFAGFAVKAGVKTALASLWNVSDEGTMGLMAEFYQQLWQAPLKAEALREAQVALLEGKVRLEQGKLIWSGGSVSLPPELAKLGTKALSHPYYWSAFTMVGSPW